jgi:hypothetical protein
MSMGLVSMASVFCDKCCLPTRICAAKKGMEFKVANKLVTRHVK